MEQQSIDQLRKVLLTLHKELLDFEKKQYEVANGPITPAEYFSVVTTNSDFAWLQELTQAIVELDEREAQGEDMATFVDVIRALFADGGAFAQRLVAIRETSSAVAAAHASVLHELKNSENTQSV